MADTLKTVKSSGGDYSTLSGWESGQQKAISAGNTETAECYAFEDTTYCLVNGWTTASDAYIIIKAASGNQHTFTTGTGYRLKTNNNYYCLSIYQGYTRVQGISCWDTNTSTGNGRYALTLASGSGGSRVTECLVVSSSTDTGACQLVPGASAARVIIANTSVLGKSKIGLIVSSGTASIFNCDLVGSTYGLQFSWPDSGVRIKNTYCHGGTAAIYDPNGNYPSNITFTTCRHSDAGTWTGSTGSTAYSTANFTNVTAGTEDLHIVTGSALKDAGTDLSGDGDYAFSIDGDGTSRAIGSPPSWDVGFDEFVSGTTIAEIVGTASGSGAATGVIGRTSPVIGTSAGSGASSGAVAHIKPIIGTAAGVGAASGALATRRDIVGTAAGTGAASGALAGISLIVGTAAGVGAATGELAGIRPVVGSAAGVGAATGILAHVLPIVGTSSGVGAAVGVVEDTASGVAEIVGTAAGTGTATGQVAAIAPIVGTSAGVGAATGVVDNAASGVANIVGTAAGAGAASGAVAHIKPVIGTAAGAGAASGAMATLRDIVGSAAGVGAANGIFARLAAITGTAAGSGAATGIIGRYAPIIGTSVGVASVAGVLEDTGAYVPNGLEPMIYTALTASASLMAYVTDPTSPPEYRVYPEEAPQTAAFPLIVYRIIAVEPVKSMSGASGYARGLVQVDCYARLFSTAKAMSEIVEDVLFGNFATFKGIKQDRRNSFEEGPRVHNVSQDFAVWSTWS